MRVTMYGSILFYNNSNQYSSSGGGHSESTSSVTALESTSSPIASSSDSRSSSSKGSISFTGYRSIAFAASLHKDLTVGWMPLASKRGRPLLRALAGMYGKLPNCQRASNAQLSVLTNLLVAPNRTRASFHEQPEAQAVTTSHVLEVGIKGLTLRRHCPHCESRDRTCVTRKTDKYAKGKYPNQYCHRERTRDDLSHSFVLHLNLVR